MPFYPSLQFIAQLKVFEGFYPLPYTCTAGKATIGYGTNLEAHPSFIPYADLQLEVRRGAVRGKALVHKLKKRGMRWTAQDAESAMLAEVQAVAADLSKRCPAFLDCLARFEVVRAEALLDMAYNMGVDGLLGFFTFLPRMERGEWDDAANGLRNTAWYRQVGRRSRYIAEQIRTGAYDASLR